MEIVYIEPADYFPEEVRKKYKLGEYAESESEEDEDVESENTEGKTISS